MIRLLRANADQPYIRTESIGRRGLRSSRCAASSMRQGHRPAMGFPSHRELEAEGIPVLADLRHLVELERRAEDGEAPLVGTHHPRVLPEPLRRSRRGGVLCRRGNTDVEPHHRGVTDDPVSLRKQHPTLGANSQRAGACRRAVSQRSQGIV